MCFFKVQNGNDTHFWLFWGDFWCYGKTENCKTIPFGNVKNIWNVCYLNSFWKYLSPIVKPKRQTLPEVIEMAKHFQFQFFFPIYKKGFFLVSSFAIIRKSPVFCTIAKMVCHRHCTMFSVMFQTKTWLKAERGTTSQEQIEKWSCLSSNGPLNVLLIISISAELLLLCTLWGQIFFEVSIEFLHYCIENESREASRIKFQF